MTIAQPRPLSGMSVGVIEQEPLIAAFIEQVAFDLGAGCVLAAGGPSAPVDERLLGVHLCVADLADPTTHRVARMLARLPAAGPRFVLTTTGLVDTAGMPVARGSTIIEKPFDDAQLARALAGAARVPGARCGDQATAAVG